MRRLYFYALAVFVVFITAVNAITFLTEFNKKQLINLFFVSERANSIGMLAEHIIFESGFILNEESYDSISKYIHDSCKDAGVDPLLVHTIISSGGSSAYSIDINGAIGYMHVRPTTARRYTDRDPFSTADNIYIGVHHLSELIAENGGIEAAVEKYFTPVNSVRAESVYKQYIGILADISKERLVP